MDLSRDYVSWAAIQPEGFDNNRDVFYHDLHVGQTVRLWSTFAGNQGMNSVDGDRIVWMDDRNGNWDIYMYDIGQQREVRLTTDPFDQAIPALSGDLLVFRDFRFTQGHRIPSGHCASDLYVLDISTLIGRRITTNPWWWRPLAPISEGRVLAMDGKLWIFDLIQMGILDPTGEHVVPE